MKNILFFVVFTLGLNLYSQNKYITRNGTVSFEASVSAFEEVKANNTTATAIINIETGELASLIFVKGFRFKNALMEEHFNENYAESDLYPKATFKGQIIDFSIDKLKNEKQNLNITGTLSFHGKTITLENTTVKVSFEEGVLNISGYFITDPANFNIPIPKIVKHKIAKEINVFFLFNMKKKQTKSL